MLSALEILVSDMVVLSNRGGSNLIFLHEDDSF